MLASFTFFYKFFLFKFCIKNLIRSIPYLQHYIYSLAFVFASKIVVRSTINRAAKPIVKSIPLPPIPPLSTDRLTEETKAPWGHHRHIKRCWRMAGSRANLQLSSPDAIEEISLNLVQRTRVAAFFNRLSCSWLASSIGSTIAPRVTHAAIEIFSTAPNNRHIDHHPCNLRLNIGAIFLRVKN